MTRLVDHRVFGIFVLATLVGCGGRDDRRRGPFDAGTMGVDGGPIVDGGTERDVGTPDDDAGGGDTDAGIDPGTDTRRFVPEFPNTYGGMAADPGFEVIAHTVRVEPVYENLEYLVAIRNTFSLTICSMSLITRFYDVGGTQIGSTSGPVESVPHRGCSGTCGMVLCLGPGHIGMQSSRIDLGGRGAESIARAEWTTGGVNLIDAVPTSELTVTGVMETDDGFGNKVLRGQLYNYGGSTLRNPEIAIFGVNAVGRPLFETGDVDFSNLPSGTAWSFMTSPSFEETYADLVEFPQADDL